MAGGGSLACTRFSSLAGSGTTAGGGDGCRADTGQRFEVGHKRERGRKRWHRSRSRAHTAHCERLLVEALTRSWSRHSALGTHSLARLEACSRSQLSASLTLASRRSTRLSCRARISPATVKVTLLRAECSAVRSRSPRFATAAARTHGLHEGLREENESACAIGARADRFAARSLARTYVLFCSVLFEELRDCEWAPIMRARCTLPFRE